MGRIVGRTKLARKQTGERLHLVATGKQRELFGVGGAYLLQAFTQDREGLFPADRFKLPLAAFSAFFAQQRLRQSGG